MQKKKAKEKKQQSDSGINRKLLKITLLLEPYGRDVAAVGRSEL